MLKVKLYYTASISKLLLAIAIGDKTHWYKLGLKG